MWKRLDKNIYSSLRRYEGKCNSAGYLIFSVLVFVGMLILFNRIHKNDHTGIILCAAMGIVSAALLVAAVAEKIRWGRYSELLDGSHGEYCKATLIKKLHTEPDTANSCYYIIAEAAGKQIKLRCTEEVFAMKECGEQLIVVDLSGSGGKLRRFCIGLAALPEPVKSHDADPYPFDLSELTAEVSGQEKEELINNLLEEINSRRSIDDGKLSAGSGLYEPDRSGNSSYEAIPQDICDELIKQEKRKMIRLFLFMIISPAVFLTTIILAPVIMQAADDILNYGIIHSAFMLFGITSIYTTIVSLAVYGKMFGAAKKHRTILRKGSARCERLTYLSSSYYRYTKRRIPYIYRKYFHLCRNSGGDRVVVRSDAPVSSQSGETVIVVCYSDEDRIIYPAAE